MAAIIPAAVSGPAAGAISTRLIGMLGALKWPAEDAGHKLAKDISEYRSEGPDGKAAQKHEDARGIARQAETQMGILGGLHQYITRDAEAGRQFRTQIDAHRNAVIVAEELAAVRDYLSAAALFNALAYGVTRLANRFSYFERWKDFLDEGHYHMLAAAFLYERAGDYYVLAGSPEGAVDNFLNSATNYLRVSSRLGQFNTLELEKRALKKAAESGIASGRLVEAARALRASDEHEMAAETIEKELRLRREQPERRNSSTVADHELFADMRDSLSKTGNPERAAELQEELGEGTGVVASEWEWVAKHHRQKGHYASMARAHRRGLGKYLKEPAALPDLRNLIAAASAAWGLERALSTKEEKVDRSEIVDARMDMATVLGKLGFTGSQLAAMQLLAEVYPDAKGLDSIQAEISSLSNRVGEIVIPAEPIAGQDPEAIYAAAGSLMRKGLLKEAAGALRLIMDSTNEDVAFSEWHDRAKADWTAVIWLEAVLTAGREMALGRSKKVAGQFAEASKAFWRAREGLASLIDETKKERYSDSFAYDEAPDMHADAVEAFVRASMRAKLIDLQKGADLLADAARLFHWNSDDRERPSRRVGDLYVNAGDILREGANGDETRIALAYSYYTQAVRAYADGRLDEQRNKVWKIIEGLRPVSK